jgi:DNA-dependent RNA polymerase auxiliary subunit epsilon
VDVSGWTLLGLAWGVGGTQAYQLHEELYGDVHVRTWVRHGARDVELIDQVSGASVGYHQQGEHYPHWTCSTDHSWIECRVLTEGPHYDDRINELRLGRVGYDGHAMGRVWEIQRLQTQGGMPPHTTHHHRVGEYYYSPYSAVYAFWGEEP